MGLKSAEEGAAFFSLIATKQRVNGRSKEWYCLLSFDLTNVISFIASLRPTEIEWCERILLESEGCGRWL